MLINRRSRYFERFLNSVLKNKLLKSSDVFMDFLMISSANDFLKKKAEYDEDCAVTKLKETENIEGILYCRYSPEISKQHDAINDYVHSSEAVLQKVVSVFEQLRSDLLVVSQRMSEIQILFDSWNSLCVNYSENDNILKATESLTSLFKTWSKAYKKGSGLADVEFKEFFEFYRMELNTFKETLNRHNSKREDYFKSLRVLNKRKEELFNSQNYSKWELSQEEIQALDQNSLGDRDFVYSVILKKETSKVNEKRQRLGIVSSNLLSSFFELRYNFGNRMKNHFLNMSSRHSEILTDIFELVRILNWSIDEKGNDLAEN